MRHSVFRCLGTLAFWGILTFGRVALSAADDIALVRDIAPGADGSNVVQLGKLGRFLLLSAYDTVDGVELWRSDGTPDGTVRITDLAGPGALPGYLGKLVPFRSGHLFTAKPTGASTVKIFWVTPDASEARFVHDLKGKTSIRSVDIGVWNEIAYFAATDEAGDTELWCSDGTPEGTRKFLDLNPAGHSNPRDFFPFPGRGLLFRATTAQFSEALFISDGAVEGTKLLCGHSPAVSPLNSYLGVINGYCFLGVDDGIHGDELWRTDGTPEGTNLFLDIDDDPNSYNHGVSAPEAGRVADSYLVFVASKGPLGREPWVTDGTLEGTNLLMDINPGVPSASTSGDSLAGGFVGKGDVTYFNAVRASWRPSIIWRSDGTLHGTVPVYEVDSETSFDGASPSMLVHGSLFFSALNASDGYNELWRSDGTAAGTAFWLDIPPTDRSSTPIPQGAVNGYLLIQAETPAYGKELMAVDLAPWVESIAPVEAGPNSAQEAAFHVNFSEAVDGVTTGSFSLMEEGTEGATVVAVEEVAGQDFTWQVWVDTGTGNGKIWLRLEDVDQIHDRQGQQPLVGWASLADGTFTGDQPLLVAKANPVPMLKANVSAETRKAHARLTIAFDRPVEGLNSTALELVNAHWAGEWSGDGTQYSTTVLADSPGAVAARIRGGVALDSEAKANAPSRWLEWRFLPSGTHSADSDSDLTISLSELLRVIQLYNATGTQLAGFYTCQPSGEDGYGLTEVEATLEDCPPHAVDYAPQDWRIGLSELLRVIQIYNQPGRGYTICPESPQSEDGFCLEAIAP